MCLQVELASLVIASANGRHVGGGQDESKWYQLPRDESILGDRTWLTILTFAPDEKNGFKL